ncbi:MAG TPA: right-handed parallel beta-helix repeat-containing protein [Phycisphaerales bacterium]
MRRPIDRTAVSCLLLSAGIASAGPLMPPAGPVASTPGPEPRIAINAVNTPGDADGTPSVYKITQPGSYYLAGNITGQASKDGIEIACSHVTIDLNGFTLQGVNGSNTGIVAAGPYRGIVIRNGTIDNWSNRGIELEGQSPAASPTGAVIEGVIITGQSEVGIEVAGDATISGVTIDGVNSGIVGGVGVTIRDSKLRVQSTGVDVDSAGLIERCDHRGGQVGLTVGGRGSVVRDCVVSDVDIGITISVGVGNDGALIEGCVVSSFTNLGIAATGTGSARVEGNTISGDAALLPSAGIWIGDLCQATNNVVRNVRGNAGASVGILVSGVIGRANVRGNTVVNCDKGIKANNGGNAIYSNELSQNTKHFELASGNRVGPISIGTLSPQIDGSTGGAGMGSTDPTANILY